MNQEDPKEWPLKELREAAEDIIERFCLDQVLEVLSPDTEALYSELHTRLRQHIARLLDRKPEQLMQQLYRLDVGERKVKEAFAGVPGIDLAGTLAHLVIERQLQKMLLRARAQRFLPPPQEAQRASKEGQEEPKKLT